ncbi:MAG: prephenate/arogenate dehydrogenase family protein [Pseudomonadota bacterium]
MSSTDAASPPCARLCLIGLGLIGSSLARAAKETGAAAEIVAFDRDPAVRARAGELGLAERVPDRAVEAVAEADLVILCVPVGAMPGVAAEIAPALAEGAIVSDVGSVKEAVVAGVGPALDGRRAHFLPAHPVAGTEQSGPDAGFASLFRDRWCILTPPEDADPAALARLSAFWTRLGARLETMTPAHHDRVLAVTSHLPHLIAYTIVGTASDLEEVTQSEVMKFSAGGFRDFTRLAASDPTMWRDVFLNNRDATLELLGRFTEDLIALQRAIRWGEGDALFDSFARTRAIRRGILELGQDVSAPDFGRASAPSSDRKASPKPSGGAETG